MRVLRNDTETEQRYTELLELSPAASVYQTIDWLRVFESLGCDLIFVEADKDSLIPFVCRGKGRLRRAFSLPYDTYGGPVTREKIAVPYDEVLKTLAIPSARVVDFQSNMAPTNCKVETVRTHLVDLSGGYEKVFEGYSKMNQRALRQASKRGLRISVIDRVEEIPSFYRLYRRTMLQYRTPPLPRRFFESIFRFMVPKGLARFYLAWREDKAIAGNLVLCYKGKAYDWTWGYDKKDLSLRPTNALIDRAIRDEIEGGTTVFNLGTSPANSNGNTAFKENFGAKEYAYNILSKSGLCYQTARVIKQKSIRLRRLR